MDYRARQQRLARVLRQGGLSALLVSHLANVRYLCGFTGSAGVLAVSAEGRHPLLTLFTDGRYREQARQEVRGARIAIGREAALTAALLWVQGRPTRRIAVEGEHLSAAAWQRLRELLKAPAGRLVTSVGLVEGLRMVKDPEEVERLRAAVLLGSSLFEPVLRQVRPGVAEERVAAELEYQARRAGAQGMSFPTIVAGGGRSALPHGVASSQPVPNTGFVILDFGVILSGYCSDMTRTVHVGKPSAQARRMYEAVWAAQAAAIGAVRPGATVAQVDGAARRVLGKAGYARYFTHSTGHGVGLEIHEAPRVARGQTEVLRPGMVITIEPGIYLPGKGGVRIEDMVAVTEHGCEVLTPTGKTLVVL